MRRYRNHDRPTQRRHYCSPSMLDDGAYDNDEDEHDSYDD